MQKVSVTLGPRSYNIHIGYHSLNYFRQGLSTILSGNKAAIITNPKLRSLYGETIFQQLEESQISPIVIEIPAGERYKTLKSVQRIYDSLITNNFERNSFIIALGGGVIGDMAGFVAATYLRGIPYVQIPTTLVAQVDSSVGGKTGVDHPLGKNLIGAFYQPVMVWIDAEVLRTLPRRELIAGMAEVIKYGVISDENLFEFIEDNYEKILSLDQETLIHIISRSCEIKGMIVSKDERESGVRAILNFGHTVGHALETITGYKKYRHGEAIAIGMVCAAKLAENMGICDRNVYDRIKRLCNLIGLRTSMPRIEFSLMWQVLQRDKKVVNEKIRFILPEKLGKVKIVVGVEKGELQEAIQSCYGTDNLERLV